MSATGDDDLELRARLRALRTDPPPGDFQATLRRRLVAAGVAAFVLIAPPRPGRAPRVDGDAVAGTLLPSTRVAVVLFDIEGCTYDEVAAIEGVAVGTVKSRLHRGRAHLKAVLEAAEPAGPGPAPGTSGIAASSHPSRRP